MIAKASKIVEKSLRADLLNLALRLNRLLKAARADYRESPKDYRASLRLTNVADWSRLVENADNLHPGSYWSHLDRLSLVVDQLEAGQSVEGLAS